MNEPPSSITVSVYAARIPMIGWLAEHYWFVIESDAKRDRWEVWQRAKDGGESWGHLHRNLLHPTQGVGNGGSRLVHSWEGDSAEQLARKIQDAPNSYPWSNRYWAWPGPNSNTFVQWILGDQYRLGRKALGKSYWRRCRHSVRNEVT